MIYTKHTGSADKCSGIEHCEKLEKIVDLTIGLLSMTAIGFLFYVVVIMKHFN